MLTKRDTSGRIGFLHFEARRGAQLPGRRAAGINAILVGAGYNYRLVLKWLRILFARIMAAIFNAVPRPPAAAIARAA